MLHMATKIRRGAKAHLYVTEWIEFRGLSDEKVANRLGVARETVWKWRTQQNRLDPEKIAGLAAALDCDPTDLWHRPDFQSLDAIVKDSPAEVRAMAADVVRRLVKTGT